MCRARVYAWPCYREFGYSCFGSMQSYAGRLLSLNHYAFNRDPPARIRRINFARIPASCSGANSRSSLLFPFQPHSRSTGGSPLRRTTPRGKLLQTAGLGEIEDRAFDLECAIESDKRLEDVLFVPETLLVDEPRPGIVERCEDVVYR